MSLKVISMSMLALGPLSLMACDAFRDDPAEARREAHEEINEAVEDHRESVRSASMRGDAAGRVGDLAEANEELAQEVAEAQREIKKADERMAEDNEDNDDKRAGDQGNVDNRADNDSERFEAYKSETQAQFAARARARIALLETQLAAAEGKSMNDDVRKDLADAKQALAEAKRDLDEIVGGTAKVVDDGKLGVTLAINRAHRQLDKANKEMRDR